MTVRISSAIARRVTLLFRAKARFLTRAQLAPHDLAGHGPGELVHELDFARRLMRGEPRSTGLAESCAVLPIAERNSGPLRSLSMPAALM